MLNSRFNLVCLLVVLSTPLTHAQDGFKGKTLDQLQLQKQAFKKGTDFREATLTNCNLSETKLIEADFRKATISTGHFLWADLTKADFREARFVKDTAFGGAILDGANLEGLDLSECGFNVTKFRGANLRDLKGIKAASRCDFSDADLRGADLSGMRWPGADAQPKFTNARYDSKTKWPPGIDPATVGAKLVKEEDKPKVNPAPPKEPLAGNELRGTWNIVKKAGAMFPPVRMVFDGSKCTVVFDAKDKTEIECKLDTKVKPMHIDLGTTEHMNFGICELVGDTLRVCYGAGAKSKRPTEFRSSEETVLLTLKRVKPTDPLPPVFGSLDPLAEPDWEPTAKVKLKSGFSPNPHKKEFQVAGRDKTKLGGVETHIGLPHYRLDFTAGNSPLTFSVDCKKDTTLLIKLPDGTWVADDNSGGGVNPLIRIAKPESGLYEIRIGTVEKNPKGTGDATLFITEQAAKTGGEVAKKDEPRPKEGEKGLVLAGTYWRLLSLTSKGEKITDADNPADVEFLKDGKWGILHYGGSRIAGTYTVKDGRVVMTGEDKVPFLDGKMHWKPDTEMLELDTGKLLMRLKRVKPK